ncbi:fatty acid metabolism regulator [Pasteurellaceae bacterium RH1A]|nr:fatty acid metabolism regulator [Pasteurellaceae bacterium RH1A]
MDKSPILKAQSPAALAEEYIIKSIWNQHFPAGSDLPAERDLADKIGVTRTTLREVLQRLARDGWLQIQHGKATKVNNIWETAGPNLIETLIQLNPSSAALIVGDVVSLRTRMSEYYITEAIKHNQADSLRLFEKLDQLEDNPEAYMEFDWFIFRQFTFIANKPVYGLIFNTFKGLYKRVSSVYFQKPEARRINLKFYKELREICQTGQYQRVSPAILANRQECLHLWAELLPKLSELFE